MQNDVEDLKRAHASLLRHVAALRERVNTNAALLELEQQSRAAAQLRDSERALRRLLLFATGNAVQALNTPHPELSRHYATLCSASTVCQILL